MQKRQKNAAVQIQSVVRRYEGDSRAAAAVAGSATRAASR
jgi:hypothetical protein